MILGASILQLPAIIKAKEMGFEVIAVDMNPNAVGFEIEGVIREVISTIDIPSVLTAAQKHQINGIMTLASDMPMRTVAVVCRKMGLVGISEETALKATNKALMREAFQQSNVPIPLFFRVNEEDTFKDAVKKVWNAGYKCIVKPTDNSGSRGVDLLSETSDLEKAFEYSKKFSRSGEIIVEEFMEGPEVSVETLAIDGEIHVVQITDKLTTGAPYFVEMGHSQPSILSESVKEQIAQITIDANRAIGIKNGPSHTEVKVTKNGPKIVEIGARLGGDCITTHLVPLSTGIDMVECCIEIAMGKRPEIKARWNNGSAIRYIETKKGIIEKISGIPVAKKMPGIKQVSIVHGIGDMAKEIKSSVDRVGFVIAQADDSFSAIERCNYALKKIKIEIR